MAYDQDLAARIRAVLKDEPGLVEAGFRASILARTHRSLQQWLLEILIRQGIAALGASWSA
jgi:hypothetical protein